VFYCHKSNETGRTEFEYFFDNGESDAVTIAVDTRNCQCERAHGRENAGNERRIGENEYRITSIRYGFSKFRVIFEEGQELSRNGSQ